MYRLHYASQHTLAMLEDRGAEVLQVGFNEHVATFKEGGLNEMKRIQSGGKSRKTNARPKQDGDNRKTKELKALLKEKGVMLTQVMKRADMLEIANHPEKEKEIVEKVRKRWKNYLKELKEKKGKN